MTIQERQKAAETWANARADWERAEEQAQHFDTLRVNAATRLDAAREELKKVASVGSNIRTRVFATSREGKIPTQLVRVMYVDPLNISVELLKTEPNE